MSEQDDAVSDGEGHDHSEKVIMKKLILATTVLTVVAGVALYLWFMPGYYQNYAPEQPIPFSHQRHAGQFQIPCLYCHGSAEYAEFASVPGLETCMNCHTMVLPNSPWIQQVKKAYDEKKPIAWVKVHVLPDFVYFNHSRHVSAGVQCQTCHGPVETMEKVYQFSKLNMGWCIDCHRNNNYLTPSRIEFAKKRDEMRGAEPMNPVLQAMSHPDPHNADISCSTCHR